MNVFEFIKSQLPILNVVGEYTTLKRAGVYWKGHCPFHHEKTASFTVTPHRDIFYCFGCGFGGDVIAFIARAEGCSQFEAVRYLADRYALTIPEEYSFQQSEQTVEAKERYFELCHQVALWCHQQVERYSQAAAYLERRQVQQSTKVCFRIGYFPAGQNALKELYAHLKKEGFLLKDLLEARIVLEGKHGVYSPFEDRIMFPIADHVGRICGFGGRVFKPDDTRAKYYNSHDHALFNKSTVLFGLSVAKKAIQEKGSVFVVEGYLDCIAMYQAGYTNTVATLGTACTQEHLQNLSRYANKLYVLYDGDAAGQKAIVRLSEHCWNVAMELAIIVLPDNHDPDSFLGGGGKLEPLIASAKDIFEFTVDRISTNFGSKPLQERLAGIKELLEVILKLKDPLKQDMLLQRAASACGVSFTTLQKELARQQKPEGEEAKKQVQEEQKKPMPQKKMIQKEISDLEKQVFCAILNTGEKVCREDEVLLGAVLPESLAQIFHKFQTYKTDVPDSDFSSFFGTLTSEEQEFVNRLLISVPDTSESTVYDQLIKQLYKKQWKVAVTQVKTQLAQAQQAGDGQRVHVLMQEFQELKQRMVEKGLL